MTRVAALACVVVAALAPSVARESPLLPQATSPSRLLGVVWSAEGRGSSALVSVDPKSLAPLAGRRLPLFGFGAGAWAYSPDRTRLAIGGLCQIGSGLSGGITFVDVRQLRATGCIWLGGVSALLWPEPRRLVAVSGTEVVSIDPVRNRVLERAPLPQGQLVGIARAADALVLLVSSAGVGRLTIVDGRGAVGSVALDMPVGMQPREARFVEPGLAIDPVGGRAFVVPESGPVAEVRLDTLVVAYRDVHQSVSLLGRIGRWLEPAAQAKDIHPSASSSAVWLGNGLLAIAGNRSSSAGSEPSGLVLVDTRSWSKRVLDVGVNGVAVAQGRLVATGPRSGLAVFDLGGRLLYRDFAGRATWLELVHRGRIFVHVGSETRTRVLGLATGRQLGRRATPVPTLLLGSNG